MSRLSYFIIFIAAVWSIPYAEAQQTPAKTPDTDEQTASPSTEEGTNTDARIPETQTESESPAGPVPRQVGEILFLVDYLPNFMYTDETVTAVVRILNRGNTETACELKAALTYSSSRSETVVLRSFALPAGSAQQCTLNIPSVKEKLLTRSISFQLVLDGTRTMSLHPVLLIRGSDTLPRFSLTEGTFFTSEKGERIIFVIEHRVYKEDRKWLIPRLFRQSFSGKTYSSFLLLSPYLSSEEDKDGSYLNKVLSANKDIDNLAFDDFPQEGAYPILQNVYLFSKLKTAFAGQRVILFLPYSDLLLGTGKREFRMSCEFMIQQLEKKGFRNFLLVTPVYPSNLESAYSPYLEELKQVSRAYGIPIASPDLKNIDYWNIPGEKGYSVGRYLNAAGHEALAGFLNDAITE